MSSICCATASAEPGAAGASSVVGSADGTLGPASAEGALALGEPVAELVGAAAASGRRRVTCEVVTGLAAVPVALVVAEAVLGGPSTGGSPSAAGWAEAVAGEDDALGTALGALLGPPTVTAALPDVVGRTLGLLCCRAR